MITEGLLAQSERYGGDLFWEAQITYANILLPNLPYNASDREVRKWIESRGLEARSNQIVRDRVTGISPAFGYVQLDGAVDLQEAISLLNGKKMRNQKVLAKERPG